MDTVIDVIMVVGLVYAVSGVMLLVRRMTELEALVDTTVNRKPADVRTITGGRV